MKINNMFFLFVNIVGIYSVFLETSLEWPYWRYTLPSCIACSSVNSSAVESINRDFHTEGISERPH